MVRVSVTLTLTSTLRGTGSVTSNVEAEGLYVAVECMCDHNVEGLRPSTLRARDCHKQVQVSGADLYVAMEQICH